MPDFERGKASGTGANTRQGDVERGHLERRPPGRGRWKISNRAPSRRACLLGALVRLVPRAEVADVVPGAAVDLVGVGAVVVAVQDVSAVASEQQVGAGPAFDGVVPGSAEDGVVAGVAVEDVVSPLT